jgi:hypothetical protein
MSVGKKAVESMRPQSAAMTRPVRRAAFFCLALVVLLSGCATREPASPAPQLTPAEARSLIAKALPPQTEARAGWATDIYAAFATLRLEPTPSNVCAVVGITEQESSFRADPAVPGLPAIAWKQIEQRAQGLGVPMLLVRGAMQLSSPNGKSYADRIDGAKTERELSETFDDFIGMVPMGRRLFSGLNPVRTGGPMQVSVSYAEAHAKSKPYPYVLDSGLRDEVFTRRGGMYFGIAHLLDYPASYDQPLYRFADFNAGHYASRNAALQNAIGVVSGVPLVRDGDLLPPEGSERIGSTETAARAIARRLDMGEAAVHRDLEKGSGDALERSTLWERTFALADKAEGRALPRAVLPQIDLVSPKITRKLTTEWFAKRVEERYRRCLVRVGVQ